MRNLALLLWFAIATPCFSAEPNEKTRIAVTPLEAKGAPAGLTDAITDLLTAEIVATGEFQVVERGQIKKILSEQALQQSGLSEPEGAAATGKLLSVQRILVGSVAQFDFGKVVTIRLVNVETGKVEVSDRQVAESDKKLLAAVSVLSLNLAAFVSGKTIEKGGRSFRPMPPTAFSTIKVLSISEDQVEISAGSADGLKVGDRMLVYMVEKGSNKDHPKEEIRLTKVQAHNAMAVIIAKPFKEKEYIVSGDLIRALVKK